MDNIYLLRNCSYFRFEIYDPSGNSFVKNPYAPNQDR